MELNYKNVIPHIDFNRSIDAIDFSEFKLGDTEFDEFKSDMESGNDSVEMHLVKSNAYKEALVLSIRTSGFSDVIKELLREEQKTFGGSKIFYINNDCSKLLLLSVQNEIKNKVAMLISRLNKVNEKITRMNSKIKKENVDLYNYHSKDKKNLDLKEEILNLINLNFRV